MKRLLFLIVFVTIFSCKSDPEFYIEHIPGYWEIESVTFSNGETKSYTFSETIDYINVNDSLRGFRKKLKPSLDGKFNTSNDVESFKLILENDSLNAYYSTPFSEWKETILSADSLHLKVINQDKKVYLYKRFTPLKLQ